MKAGIRRRSVINGNIERRKKMYLIIKRKPMAKYESIEKIISENNGVMAKSSAKAKISRNGGING
jgi:hypothetical protein